MGEWKSLKTSSGTGWKEIDREAGTGWKALEWESVNVDIGYVAENGDTYTGNSGNTIISLYNPANDNATLDKLDVYVYQKQDGIIRIGSLYLVSGMNYKCRDAESISGLDDGLNSDIPITLDVQTGDYIGFYSAAGNSKVDAQSSGIGRTCSGNKLIVDTEATYTNWSYQLKIHASNY